jgi:hypothetical protein
MRYEMGLLVGVALLAGLAGGARGAEPGGPGAAKPALRDLVGICGHTVLFKPELYAPVAKKVRDYHPMEWDLGKDTAVLPKWPEAKNRVNWQQVYGSWQKAGEDADVCLMESGLEPKAWKDLAGDAEAYGKAFAGEFGSRGRKLVSSAEVCNEPGKYSDEQYRALFGALAKGLRAGDPQMLIGTCNINLGKSGEYSKSVECLKGMEGLYDVLTVHLYAQVEPWPTWKRSYPEDPKAPYLSTLGELIAWRDADAKGKQVWVTEFGWDCSTKKPTKKDEFIKWEGNTDVQQAQWLVRSILCFSKMDVQRAYIYFFDDNDEPKLHAAAGITRKFVPKMSYWALAQLQRVLGDYRFSKVIREEKEAAYVYDYVGVKDGRKHVYAAWSPTGSGRTATVTLPLPAGTKWELYAEALDKDASTAAAGKSGVGPVELELSESVQYLVWEAN